MGRREWVDKIGERRLDAMSVAHSSALNGAEAEKELQCNHYSRVALIGIFFFSFSESHKPDHERGFQ